MFSNHFAAHAAIKVVAIFTVAVIASFYGAPKSANAFEVDPAPGGSTPSPSITLNWNEEHQTIDGFGAAQGEDYAVILHNFISANHETELGKFLDLAFSQDRGIGLTLLRSQVPVGPWQSADASWIHPYPGLEDSPGQWKYGDEGKQVWLMKEAQKRGPVRLYSGSWSPPAWMKSTGSLKGGWLTHDHYQDYADFLAHYAKEYAESNGISLYALSVQNEPNNVDPVTGEGTDWPSSALPAPQFADLLANYIAPTFARRNIATKIIAPEPSEWQMINPYLREIKENPRALARIDIVAGHIYQGNPGEWIANAPGKPVWQTEASLRGRSTWDIDSALGWAKDLHDGLTKAQLSAWSWWVLAGFPSPPGADKQAGVLAETDAASGTYVLSKTFWTLGNFSKFIRPGFVRIGATENPVSGVHASAYKNPTTNQLVVVVINSDDVAHNFHFQPVGFTGALTPYMTPYATTASLDLAKSYDVTFGHEYSVPPRSITTYVSHKTPSDIFWRKDDGTSTIWHGGDRTRITSIAGRDSSWTVAGIRDFNGDGTSDVLWRSQKDGSIAIAYAPYVTAPVVLTQEPPEWQVAGVGDFNGNGYGDVLWRNTSDGRIVFWYDNGWTGGAVVLTQEPPEWQIAGVGDFNGNGYGDIVWRNTNDGSIVFWYDNGWTGGAPLLTQEPPEWQIAGVGNFNGNAYSDILWRNSKDGSVVIWYDNGWTGGVRLLGQVDATWKFEGIGDFDGDGQGDILWRNVSDGSVAIWYDNGSHGRWVLIGQLPLSWHVEGVGNF